MAGVFHVNREVNLSEYDALCVDEFSRSATGITNPSAMGVQIELFRSWLQMRDVNSYRAASGLPRPVVATIPEGEITFQDVIVVATRGPRDGVYFAGWFDEPGGISGIVGVGLSGRVDGQYVGVLATDVAYLADLLTTWGKAGRIPDRLARVRFESALRYCQGDLFIAESAGFPTPVTAVGCAETPLAYRPLPVGPAQKPQEAPEKP